MENALRVSSARPPAPHRNPPSSQPRDSATAPHGYMNFRKATKRLFEKAHIELAAFESAAARLLVCWERRCGRRRKPDHSYRGFQRCRLFSLRCTQRQPYASGLGVFSDIVAANIIVRFIDVRLHETTFVAETNYSTVVAEILSVPRAASQTRSNYAKVSVIGVGMTGKSGMIATVVDALSNHSIAISQSADSQTSISLPVRKEDEPEAVRSLHMAFDIGAESISPVSIVMISRFFHFSHMPFSPRRYLRCRDPVVVVFSARTRLTARTTS